MAKHERDVIKLLMKLIGHKTGDISNIEFSAQKPMFPDNSYGETRLPRSTPEEMGVDSGFLLNLFKSLYENNSCHIHKIMAVKDGHVIGELASYPFDMDTWHVTHSMCKSVTGMAIGRLVSEGKLKLDDKIADIFKSKINPVQHFFSNAVTVKDLLTMTSGVAFNESGAISANDWRKLFLEASQKNAPGSMFEYNSMNSYMLSAIVTEITGESMLDYLRPRLFEPLGIMRVFWESCPQNITKGGWGMFLRIEDMAKLGQLYLNKGMYDGKQILPEDWVLEATKTQIQTGKPASPGYGFQLWTGNDREGAYTFNGMLGQNVYCYPDINMIIITNAGNDDLFQAGNMSSIVRGAMARIEVSDGPIEVTAEVLEKQRLLNEFIESAKKPETASNSQISGGWDSKAVLMNRGRTKSVRKLLPSQRNSIRKMSSENILHKRFLNTINGVTYDMDDKGVGMMPLLMQVMHNNFTDGIKSIGFEYNEKTDTFYLIIKEGELYHRIKCTKRGQTPIYNDLNEHGEQYKLAVISELSTDEYGRAVLRNEFYFTEDSTVRVMNIYFGKREPLQHDNKTDFMSMEAPVNIGIRFDEIPGSAMLFGILDQFGSLEQIKGINGFVVNWLSEYGAMDALTLAIRDTVRPKLHGTIHTDVGKSPDSVYDGIDVGKAEMLSEDNEAIMEDD